MKHTEESNPDHQALVDSLAQMKEVVDFVNERTRQVENEAKIVELQHRVENLTV